MLLTLTNSKPLASISYLLMICFLKPYRVYALLTMVADVLMYVLKTGDYLTKLGSHDNKSSVKGSSQKTKLTPKSSVTKPTKDVPSIKLTVTDLSSSDSASDDMLNLASNHASKAGGTSTIHGHSAQISNSTMSESSFETSVNSDDESSYSESGYEMPAEISDGKNVQMKD